MPLFSVIWMLAWRGGRRLSVAVFTQLPPSAMEAGGGFGNAIVGTLLMVGLAVVITVPGGIMTAIYLAQNRQQQTCGSGALCRQGTHRLSLDSRWRIRLWGDCADHRRLLGDCGRGCALHPDVAHHYSYLGRCHPDGAYADEGSGHRHGRDPYPDGLDGAASHGHSGNSHRGDAGVARAAGETAPLLFTALFSNYWLWSHGHGQLMRPTASLAVLIYNFAGMPFENQVELAWAAALVLVLLVLAANLIGRSFSGRQVQQS